ncbi:MAG: hypothetical protein QOH49_4756 [Acidobacteriota bacterium]|nr:hypothetical protein [Acidobacteriota bacterium]
MDWVRLELTPNSLQDCRSAQLSYQPELKTIAEAGLEPAAVTVYETAALPLSYSAATLKMSLAGLEPATSRLEDERSCPSELQARV